jgi:hypothetical protein
MFITPGSGRTLTVDASDLQGSVLGALVTEFGETHRAAWVALVELDAELRSEGGRSVEARASTVAVRALGERAGRRLGANLRIWQLLGDLHDVVVVVPGYNSVYDCPADGTSFIRLLEVVSASDCGPDGSDEHGPEWLSWTLHRSFSTIPE